MQAYNIKHGTKVKIVDEDILVPPSARQINKGDIVTIFKVDRMYCNGEDEDGYPIYIAAWTEVEEI